jgi:hypothetical protein
MPNDPIAPLDQLVGSWAIEATHPALPTAVARGQADFEWLEGKRFLLQRSQTDHPDFPDSLIVFGEFEDGLAMHYYDSRGVHRMYSVSFSDGVWEMWRNASGFSQRFTGTFSDDADAIEGLWKLSRDDKTWDDDLKISFRRR